MSPEVSFLLPCSDLRVKRGMHVPQLQIPFPHSKKQLCLETQYHQPIKLIFLLSIVLACRMVCTHHFGFASELQDSYKSKEMVPRFMLAHIQT